MPSIDRQTVTAHIYDVSPSGPGAVLARSLAIESGSCTIDQTWTPYVQGSFTYPVGPLDEFPANRAQLDPRNSNYRVTLEMRQQFSDSDTVAVLTTLFGSGTVAALTAAYGSGTVAAITAQRNRPWTVGEYRRPVIRKANLGIRRYVRSDDGTCTVTLASDEARLQDYRQWGLQGGDGTVAPFGLMGPTMLVALIKFVLATVIPTTPSTLLVTADDYSLAAFNVQIFNSSGAVIAQGVDWKFGVTAWDFLAPYVQLAGARLWCDESNIWHLDRLLEPTDGTLSLTGGTSVGASMLGYSESISRDDEWYDGVAVHYTWTTTAGVDKEYVEWDISAGNSHVYIVDRDLGDNRPAGFWPPDGAAAAIKRQLDAVGRAVPIVAVNDFAADTGSALTIALPFNLDIPITGRVSAIGWDFGSGDMTVTSRNLI